MKPQVAYYKKHFSQVICGQLFLNAEFNSPRFILKKITRSDIVRVMAHITVKVEYGLHCLLWLIEADAVPLSSRDLAELQGISPSFLVKIFAKLEKAGIVNATEGVRGGYVLARKPESISFLQIVDAIEGRKPLFDCQDIRGRCAVFGDQPPTWATSGLCSIHKIMLQAEKAMRKTLAEQSLADLAVMVDHKAPSDFSASVKDWIDDRVKSRIRKPKVSSLTSSVRKAMS
ncbi:RrF2 family transcriptional regulator [Candidatus Nitrotoga sp. M5]|uniref:RrF2 family transcriptional regulator n=1 Tax=Candidatus Nitrotoga sp. M5 TaxID=2890409 RepID=UPI001EF46F55|nr:Rrf2 family transcriptional regulator [Candidatus Nitrotoga sp. M5]CAH1387494.1 BadM/Rrf2 family transcriptional regulator [Candidatus Nitrotoga sp. M5]